MLTMKISEQIGQKFAIASGFKLAHARLKDAARRLQLAEIEQYRTM